MLLLFIWSCKPLVAGLLTALLWPGKSHVVGVEFPVCACESNDDMRLKQRERAYRRIYPALRSIHSAARAFPPAARCLPSSLPPLRLTIPGAYKCSTGFSGVVYGLVAVEICLSYRSQRAWEVAGLVKHAFLFKTLFLVWEELRADASASRNKADGTHHAGHLAGMLTGGLFVLALYRSLRFQRLARHICRRWALPFPLLDEKCTAAAAKEEGDEEIEKIKCA